MIKKRKRYVKSRTSPKGGKRGCLCADGLTYSSKCCDGSLEAQGIGNITLGQTDSAGTIISQDTTSTTSSTSTSLPSQGNSIIVSQDTTNTIVNSSSTAIVSMAITPGIYSVGDSLPLVATFNQEVTVETSGGTPTIDVSIDENTREFSYTEGSGTDDLTFEYTLVEDDAAFETVEVASDIQLNGGSIIDGGGDPVETTTESIVIETVDVTPPQIVITTPEVIPNANESTIYRYPKAIKDSGANILLQTYDFMTASEINTYHGTTYYNSDFFSFYVDTSSIEIGSFLYTSAPSIFDENNTHRSGGATVYTPWADLDDVNYVSLKSNIINFILDGLWNLYPVYKFEKIDGYLRCTEIISEPPL